MIPIPPPSVPPFSVPFPSELLSVVVVVVGVALEEWTLSLVVAVALVALVVMVALVVVVVFFEEWVPVMIVLKE